MLTTRVAQLALSAWHVRLLVFESNIFKFELAISSFWIIKVEYGNVKKNPHNQAGRVGEDMWATVHLFRRDKQSWYIFHDRAKTKPVRAYYILFCKRTVFSSVKRTFVDNS